MTRADATVSTAQGERRVLHARFPGWPTRRSGTATELGHKLARSTDWQLARVVIRDGDHVLNRRLASYSM